MTSSRILILLLIAAAVCMVSAGVGAADDVDVTFEGHFGAAVHTTTQLMSVAITASLRLTHS